MHGALSKNLSPSLKRTHSSIRQSQLSSLLSATVRDSIIKGRLISTNTDYKIYATRCFFIPAIIDPRPSRAIHCPDLNACLINERRSAWSRIDCQAVHFGYAIPVNIVPLKENPNVASVRLDSSAKLSREVTDFLIKHHPQLKHRSHKLDNQDTLCLGMAATAKHDLRRKFPTEKSSGDEDIAAIAKQISDHAEAIYQTWKSRGLAPTEILNCHSNATAADKFGTVLTPGNSKFEAESSPQTAVEILSQSPNLDNGNLEKLVNNFVVEDKARIAASKQRSPSKTLPSSIQFALEKFERNSAQQKQEQHQVKSDLKETKNVLLSPKSQFPNKPSQIVKPQCPAKPTSISRHQDVFLETIEARYPPDLTPSKITVQQKRPSSTIISITSPSGGFGADTINSGLTTWPLKTKLNDAKRGESNFAKIQEMKMTTKDDNRVTSSNSSAYIDEVAREEERLINALKTGSLITENSFDRSSCLTTRQKPAIKKEKPKVDPVKPILVGHTHGINQVVPCSPMVMPALSVEKSEGTESLPTCTPVTIPASIPVSSIASTPAAVAVTAIDATSDETPVLSKDRLSSMSMVDYAKIRYKAAQQNSLTQQRLEEQKSTSTTPCGLTYSNDHLVTNARMKFEKEINKDEKNFGISRWGSKISSTRQRLEQVPHPELTMQQKQHIRAAAATATGNNPIRPFLTRGSVAERVLIFEKCPSELLLDKRGPRQPAISTWRTGHEVQNKAQTYTKDKSNQKSLPPHTTLQRHVKENRNVLIPRFYFPGGKPVPLSQLEATISRITAAFQTLPGHRASRTQFHIITKACDLPLYWKVPLFLAVDGDQNGYVEMNTFLEFWRELSNTCHDAASKFINITTRRLRNNILPEDLVPLVQDVVETHPGLTFLQETREFHSRYVHTVIARIFYCVNRSWSGKISLAELRRSNLLAVIAILEHEEDINQVTAYFSYEHFYVIYCKFWEIDRDHDLSIDKKDLTRHNDHALSTRMIDRIFSGAVMRGGVKGGNGIQQSEDKMSYTEFVWFLLSEEDKNHPTAIEYWFRCMDLDGDGYLSMYELEYFYEEQLHRMEAIGMETLPFEDCLCQMLDMIHPTEPGKISLSDLKRCKMTSIFFDTFFNLEKYLDHEHRDAFASARDHDAEGHEVTDWDRFAAEEYELLVAEESGNDQSEQLLLNPAIESAICSSSDMFLKDTAEHLLSDGSVSLKMYSNDSTVPTVNEPEDMSYGDDLGSDSLAIDD